MYWLYAHNILNWLLKGFSSEGRVEAPIVGTAQSSESEGGHSSRLVDGMGLNGLYGSNGCAHTLSGIGSTEWFSLELDTPRIVTKVQIARRMEDCCWYQGQGVKITIGPSRVYDPNEPLCLPEIPDLTRTSGLVDYICTGGPKEGKYVKISSADYLVLCEAKVFVKSAATTTETTPTTPTTTTTGTSTFPASTASWWYRTLYCFSISKCPIMSRYRGSFRGKCTWPEVCNIQYTKWRWIIKILSL